MFQNVLLIDRDVPNYKEIVESVNAKTAPIIYTVSTKPEDLYNELNKFKNFSRIGIFNSYKELNFNFINNKPFFEDNDLYDNKIEYSTNLNLILEIINNFNISNIDFFACETLLNPKFKKYYNILQKETNVVVGASNNKTGNLQYGGDWIMETTNEDIRDIYFTNKVSYYNYLLDFIRSFMVIRTYNNIFYGSGNNSSGQFGNGTNTSTTSFIPVFTSLPSSDIINGIGGISSNTDSTLYITVNNNSVYCCGNNSAGQFGNGTNISSNVLVPAFTHGYPAGKIINKIINGLNNAFLLMTDNSVYCCGNNLNGQFGNGTTSSANYFLVPAFTIGYPPGKIINSIYQTYNTSFLLMTDNSVYCCGNNSFGQFGNGTQLDSNVFLVPAFTVGYPSGKIIKQIYTTSAAIFLQMTDNSVYCCGNNSAGQFGNGTTTNSNVLVPAFTNLPVGEVIDKLIISRRISLVYTYNKSFYICGINTSGQFGNGTNINSNVLVPAFTVGYPSGKTIKQVTLLDDTSFLLTTDGLMYCCGLNTSGQFGNGTTTNSNVLSNTMSDVFYMFNSTCLNSSCPISNICFLAGTLIRCDQEIVTIENINPEIHTINNKKIIDITTTKSTYDFLICFEKHSLGNNIPSQKTVMTHGHEIFYNGKMRKAIEFIEHSDNIYKVKYKGEILYNVLLEKHDKMIANNLITETLNPVNPIAKMYTNLKKCDEYTREIIIKQYNDFMIKNNKFTPKQLRKV